MDNPYMTYAPQTMSDEQQINPFFQNTQNQSALNAQLMQQGQQLSAPMQQSGQSNPMALAQALRKMNPDQSGVSSWDNMKAFANSKFGRDEMQPNSPAVQNMVEQYYGSSVPNIWSM